MRIHAKTLALLLGLLSVGCGPKSVPNPPPRDRFYYPTGLLHADVAGSTDGVLYVTSSNIDRRYDSSVVTAVDLSKLGTALPPLGQAVPTSGPIQIPQLNVAEDNQVYVHSFASELAAYPLPSGGLRLFTPSRSEGDNLHAIDANGASLKCYHGSNPRSCLADAPSLTAEEKSATGKPRAPQPFAVAVAANGQGYVTHLGAADFPVGSARNLETYLVSFNAASPQIDPSSFINLACGEIGGGNTGSASDIALGQRYAYITGRRFDTSLPANTVRLFDRTATAGSGCALRYPRLQFTFPVFESRGTAVGTGERRLYIAGRTPDTLVVVDVQDALGNNPRLAVVKTLPLPAGADSVEVIPRAGRGDLVAITCTTAGMLVFYDEDLGELIAQVPGVGSQPTSLAVDQRGGAARLYVSNFGDGRVAVVDVPDVNRADTARVVAHLGEVQTCLVDRESQACKELQK
jgi:hypothetical protein